jgi:hypothetical protein
MHLIVTRSFPGHERGETITDAAEIASILASEYADHVVAVGAAEVKE